MTTNTRTELTLAETTEAIQGMTPDEHAGMLYYLLGWADTENESGLAVRKALSFAASLRLELRAERGAK